MFILQPSKYIRNKLISIENTTFYIEKEKIIHYDFFKELNLYNNRNNNDECDSIECLIPFHRNTIKKFVYYIYPELNTTKSINYDFTDSDFGTYLLAEDYIEIVIKNILSNTSINGTEIIKVFEYLNKYNLFDNHDIIKIIKVKISKGMTENIFDLFYEYKILYKFPVELIHYFVYIMNLCTQDNSNYLNKSTQLLYIESILQTISKEHINELLKNMKLIKPNIYINNVSLMKEIEYITKIYFILCIVAYEKTGDECIQFINNDKSYYTYNTYILIDFFNMIDEYGPLIQCFINIFKLFMLPRNYDICNRNVENMNSAFGKDCYPNMSLCEFKKMQNFLNFVYQ